MPPAFLILLVASFLVVLVYYFIFAPYLKGQLYLPLALVIERVIHYPKLPFVILSFKLGIKGSPYWSKVDENIYLGALPTIFHENELKEMNIKAVVNCCDEDRGPTSIYNKLGIEQLYIPTIDHTEPSVKDIERAVREFIEPHTNAGENVLIHCMAGRGRSAAVALCWLAYKYRLDLKAAQDMLLKRRPLVRKKLYQQPNVCLFYANLIV